MIIFRYQTTLLVIDSCYQTIEVLVVVLNEDSFLKDQIRHRFLFMKDEFVDNRLLSSN